MVIFKLILHGTLSWLSSFLLGKSTFGINILLSSRGEPLIHCLFLEMTPKNVDDYPGLHATTAALEPALLCPIAIQYDPRLLEVAPLGARME